MTMTAGATATDRVADASGPDSDAEARVGRVLNSRRAMLTFVAIVFATTVIQVMSNPIIALLGGPDVWSHPLPLAVVALISIVGCAAQASSLLLSVRRPAIAALLAVTCYVGLVVSLGVPTWATSMQFVVAIAMFLLSARTSVRAAIAWLVVVTLVAFSGLIGWALSTGAPFGLISGFFVEHGMSFFAPVAGATALGIWWGVRVRRVARLEAEAEAAAEEYERRVEQVRAQERNRIARELHDVAGQHIAGLLALADAAIDIEDRNPERALRLIDDIRAEGRFASASLYAALRDLRAVDGDHAVRTPDLSSLSELRDFWTKRGMSVSIESSGDPADVPAVVSTSAYRGVQEAMTNAAKHAAGAAVAVSVVVDAEWIRLRIENGPGGREAATEDRFGLGWGLDGLSERIRLLHGTVDAGATPGGGWRVDIEIPVTRAESSTSA